VEPLRRGIVFHGYTELGGAPEHRGQIDGEGFAAQQQASGWVAQNADVRVLDGADHSGRHLLAGLGEMGMNAGDDHVHLGEHLVVEVESAVGENVDFNAGEDADTAFHSAVDGGIGHLADGVVAVAGGGVHVHVAANVVERDDAGQRVRGGSVDLAEILPHLRRQPVHAEGGVDFLLGGGGHG